MALHLRVEQRRVASAPGDVGKLFSGRLEYSRAKKSVADAMVHFSDAQGSQHETAKSCKVNHRLAFFRRSSLDKNLSCNACVLVISALALSLDESGRP